MSKLDLIIRGGTVATASDTFKTDVGVRAGNAADIVSEFINHGRDIGMFKQFIRRG